ncbi:MAG: lipid-A-disaccharide synthase [Bacteroidota bacterium]|nr:lipid-A-disaccharide synthase [Bacteroidota bacterium]
MKYYIIAGEASGDLHGSNLMRQIKEKDPKAEFRFWGGDLMSDVAGSPPVKHYRDLAFMGFFEVVANLKTILRNIKFCKEDLVQWNPDVLVLIDYPGFNLRIAKFARENGIRVNYYISPQIWAWKQKRVYDIKRDVDRMLVILPFEKAFYRDFEMEVDFVGHPLLDAIEGYQKEDEQVVRESLGLDDRPVIALLPGSRKQEISTLLPLILSLVKNYPEFQFVVAGAPSQDEEFYRTLIGDHPVRLVKNSTYRLLSLAHAAIVTSGTATLETALFRVPEVVVYKGNPISYQIAKRLVKVKYISLVNLIMDREVVTELIQSDVNPRKLKSELDKILDPSHRAKLSEDLDDLYHKLGGIGASEHAATIIVEEASK